jgi:hypothetical protein
MRLCARPLSLALRTCRSQPLRRNSRQPSALNEEFIAVRNGVGILEGLVSSLLSARSLGNASSSATFPYGLSLLGPLAGARTIPRRRASRLCCRGCVRGVLG